MGHPRFAIVPSNLYNDRVKRKKFFLAALLLPGALLGLLFYPACGIGFAVSKYCSGKRDGERGKVRSIIIRWRGRQLHLHHWFLSSVAGVISAFSGFFLLSPALFYGFIGGMVLQGIYCYGDWHRIIRRKEPASVFEDIALLDCEPQEQLIV